MKRHPSLQGLSGEHHVALTLARALRSTTAAALRASLPEDGAELAAAARERFEHELSPHFVLEDRELLPLSDCGDAALRAHAEQIRDDHAALREAFSQLTADQLAAQRDVLADRLEAHVRFEERTWFPALEAALDAEALGTLARRLVPEPQSAITGFQRESDTAWVAELDCGHTQHIRHAPPFKLAPWVVDEQGRAEHVGALLSCPLCRMPRLPACARTYKSTPIYDAASLPGGLLRSHRLKRGSWGRIVVLEGLVRYILEDEGSLTFVLRPGVPGIVAPERPHHIEADPDARVRIDFLKTS
jgi:tellurite methyltransferase